MRSVPVQLYRDPAIGIYASGQQMAIQYRTMAFFLEMFLLSINFVSIMLDGRVIYSQSLLDAVMESMQNVQNNKWCITSIHSLHYKGSASPLQRPTLRD